MGADRLLQYRAVTAPLDTTGGGAAEDVTLDKWFAPGPAPRPRPRFAFTGAAAVPDLADFAVTIDFLRAPAVPPRPRPRPAQTPAETEPPPAANLAAETITADKWGGTPPGPRARVRRTHPAGESAPPVAPALAPDVVTLDQWYERPPVAPRRLRSAPPGRAFAPPIFPALPVTTVTPLRRYTLVGADRSVVTLSGARRTQMPDSLIQDYAPPLKWPAGQVQTVRVTPTLPAGRGLADWDAFTLTIREDPEFARAGEDLADIVLADPLADLWAVSTSATGTVSGSTISFSVTVPEAAGFRRYAIDIVATGGTAGRVQLFAATYLSVLPSLKAF